MFLIEDFLGKLQIERSVYLLFIEILHSFLRCQISVNVFKFSIKSYGGDQNFRTNYRQEVNHSLVS